MKDNNCNRLYIVQYYRLGIYTVDLFISDVFIIYINYLEKRHIYIYIKYL